MSIEEAIHAFTLRHPVREKKLVGVSGGRDSVALLHALVAGGHRRLVVCHLDHRLRGRSSRADAAFVGRLAERLGLKLEVDSVDVAAAAWDAGESEESAGRRARHRFFAACARRHRCRKVILAHHADDQAETVLFNLFRGSAGLKGMRNEVAMPVAGSKTPLQLLRPLLTVSRQDIDAWLTKHGIKFREDASNGSMDPVRNRIRHELMPAICRVMGRDVRAAICRAAAISSEESDWLDSLAAPYAAHEELDGRTLKLQPPALQRRIIHTWLKSRGFTGIGAAAVESVRGLLDTVEGPVAVNLPGNRFVRRSKAKLRALP